VASERVDEQASRLFDAASDHAANDRSQYRHAFCPCNVRGLGFFHSDQLLVQLKWMTPYFKAAGLPRVPERNLSHRAET